MLHSLNSSSSHDQEEEEELDHTHIHQDIPLNLHFLPYHHHHQRIAPLPPPPQPHKATELFPVLRGSSSLISSTASSSSLTASSSSLTSSNLRQLLIRCAELLSQLDFSTAHQILSILSSNSSPRGDSSERLTHYFTRALSLHLNPDHLQDEQERGQDNNKEALQSCYLSMNQVTPFIRFSHLTANQAILEAIEQGQTPGQDQGQGQGQPSPIHIIDFNIMHGVQWPPFMQALADRYGSSSPLLRITATGNDQTTLQRTGDRLSKFAQSLGLRFQFNPLLLLDDDPTSLALFLPSAIRVFPDEALAVNCVLYLHRLIKDDEENNGGGGDDLKLFLQRVKSLGPKVVTIAEREANHNHPMFMHRFMEALDHFSAIFDSLEATLPGNSKERLEVERVWLGKEIKDILGSNHNSTRSSIGSVEIGFLRRNKEIKRMRRKGRHQRFESWEGLMRSAGFNNLALSSFALSQAKLLLRLHYPSEGYHLQVLNDSFFLGWHNRALFSVSSWS